MRASIIAAPLALAAGAAAQSKGNVTYTTKVVTAYTTYCPGPTSIVQNGKTYTVTKATTLTINNCPCTLTVPVVPALATGAAPVVPVSPVVYNTPAAPGAPVPSVAVVPAKGSPAVAAAPVVSVTPVVGAAAPTAAVAAPAAATFTGAANSMAASGAGVAGLAAIAALFL